MSEIIHLFLVTDIQEVVLVEAGVRPKSMTTIGSGELHEVFPLPTSRDTASVIHGSVVQHSVYSGYHCM